MIEYARGADDVDKTPFVEATQPGRDELGEQYGEFMEQISEFVLE